MIAAWMLWSIGVGLLLLVAGLAAERLFEGRRRWVWAVACAGTVLLTAVRVFATGGSGSEDLSGGLVMTEVAAPGPNAAGALEGVEAATGTLPGTSSPAFLPVAIPHDSVLHTLDGILLPAWLALSAGLALWALIGAGRLRRRRRDWEPGTLLNQPVWSRDTGPAIVGLFRPSVVLPSWVSDVEASKQRLILAHEEEHRRAGDGILRFAMAALLVAFPWNPFLWLHYRHLCLAIELDCDHRVMRRLPDRRWLYGDLLVLAGARRGIRPGFAPTAFAERRSFLERRIGRLLSEAPEVPMARAAFFAFAAILVVGVAMWVPGVSEEAIRSAYEPEAFEVYEHEPDQPLPVVSLPVAPSPFQAAYEVPPVPSDASVMETPQYVYHTTYPMLANRWHVKHALEDKYPATLKDEGIGGTKVLYLFVNTDGTVSDAIVKTSSGHPSLDWAAVQAAKSARFLPASNEGVPVGIWIEMEMPFVAE